MKRFTVVGTSLLLCLCAWFSASGQEDLKPWEKLGISQTEWKMIKDRNIPESRVHEILKAGISISEYVKQPWKDLGLSEREWIEKRRAGLTEYDIELDKTLKSTEWKNESQEVAKEEFSSVSNDKNKGLALSFVLPGYQQLRREQKRRGRIMTGIAVGSVAACLVGTAYQGRFEGLPLFVVLVPDMFWSFIDFKITLGKEGR